MRVLCNMITQNGLFIGIDPGTKKRNLGFAAVDERGQLVCSYEVKHLSMAIPGTAPDDGVSSKLWSLHSRISYHMGILGRMHPGKVLLAGIEDQWVGKNSQVALTLSKQWGVIFGSLAAYDVYSIRIQPTQAKKALTGYGRADKEKMVEFAQQIGMDGDNDNVADAIGIALAARQKYMEYQLGKL